MVLSLETNYMSCTEGKQTDSLPGTVLGLLVSILSPGERDCASPLTNLGRAEVSTKRTKNLLGPSRKYQPLI